MDNNIYGDKIGHYLESKDFNIKTIETILKGNTSGQFLDSHHKCHYKLPLDEKPTFLSLTS